MKKWMLLFIFVTMFLCSCGRVNPLETTSPTEIEEKKFCVSFEAHGSVFAQQNLTAAELPKPFDMHLTGGLIVGWTDSNGESVDPFSTRVDSDVTYFAVIRPELSKHEPYLFVNGEGLACPDSPLTQQALSQALYALATKEAKLYFPKLSDEDTAVTWEALTTQLCYFFEQAQVQKAFPRSQSISRVDFALGMNQLLGRESTERLTLPDGYTIPIDILVSTQADTLLEAVIAHTPSEQGQTWSQVKPSFALKPGFVNVDGWLYYVKEDGSILTDGRFGTLYFGPNGRYTSSDAELDQIVADLLKKMISENPDVDRLKLLRVAFDYCHQNFTYRRIYDGNPEYNATGWEIKLAKDMFTSRKGNCYSFAAIFWALARGIGYEARAISGQCLSDRQPHSWCMIELDGEDYIFDPEWQYNYTQREIFHYDMFMISLKRATFWSYRWEK